MCATSFPFFINISFKVPPDIPTVASASELTDSSADPAKNWHVGRGLLRIDTDD